MEDTNSVPPHEFKRGSRKRPYCVAVFDGKLCGGRYDETPHLAFEDARNAELERTEATLGDLQLDEQQRPRFCPECVADQEKCSACGARVNEMCGSVAQTTLKDFIANDPHRTDRTITINRHFPDWQVSYRDANGSTAYVITYTLHEAQEIAEGWLTKP